MPEPEQQPTERETTALIEVKKKGRLQGAAAAAAILIALVGGSVAAKQLLESGAATTASSRKGLPAIVQAVKSPVPFLGPYAKDKKGYAECGPGVKLMEGALQRTKPPIRRAKPANCIGNATVKQIKTLQARHHLPQTGIYGLRTHRALAPSYGPGQRAALVKLATARRDALRRSTILVVTSHAKTFERQMIYCDHGSLASCSHRGDWPPWPGVPHHTDCSGYVSWVLFQAAGLNPNGTGVGTTKTLIYHGIPIGRNGPLKVGDLIFYGANTHVAIYIGHGLVSSHGRNFIDIHPYGYRPIYGIRRYF